MSLPFTSLNAATAAGPGVVNDLETVSNEHTMIAGCTGSTPGPFGASIALEGSHDGVTWISLSGISFSTGSITGETGTSVGSALVRYVRANLTGIFGGTAPTVTATIASKITEDD
jgi:hypothetical protein